MKKIKLLSLLCVIALVFATKSQACTLWGIAGESVKGGGTIVCKNRDRIPDHQQQLRLVEPKNGYCYLSLFGKNSNPKAGVNEKGLTVVSASPPRQLRLPENYRGSQNNAYLLTHFASAAEARLELTKGHWTYGPGSIIIADRREVINIEFGLNGSYSINADTKSGMVCQTNHFLSELLQPYNHVNLGSSITRYNRIKALLETQNSFNMEDCIDISNDKVLWRQGGTKPNSVRTVCSWILYQKADGHGELYLKMANPGKPVREYRLKLEDVFANKVDLSLIK